MCSSDLYCGLAGYDPRVDFNDDCIANIQDFSLLSSNYLRYSPIPAHKPEGSQQTLRVLRDTGTVSIGLVPASLSVEADTIFTVTIQIEAGEQPVDGVDAFLNFDP